MKRVKKTPNVARMSGYRPSEVGPAIKSMGQTPIISSPTKITLQVIWNDAEADRYKVVEDIRATQLKFSTAGDNHTFTFETNSDASEFESMVGRLTNLKASVYHYQGRMEQGKKRP